MGGEGMGGGEYGMKCLREGVGLEEDLERMG